MSNINLFSKTEMDIRSLETHINRLEMNRILNMLKGLKNDAVRLTKCIDDIEAFHRDMFVLLSTEDKPADIKNGPSVEDSKCIVTEPNCCVSEPEGSMNEPNCTVKRPHFLIDEQNSSKNDQESKMNDQRIILKIPKSVLCNILPGENEPNYSYGPSVCKNQSGGGTEESGEDMEESGDNMEESGDNIMESGDGKEELSYSTGESFNTTEDSCDGPDGYGDDMDESGYGKDGLDYRKELAKEALLELLADREKEITKLVLHLISKFSCFQNRLETVESDVSQAGKPFSGGIAFTIMKKMKSLCGSVLYLDKTISNIYAKYSEMLERVRKAVQ